MMSLGPAQAAPVTLTDEAPVSVNRLADGTWLVDFGQVAFGNLAIRPTGRAGDTVTVHFGEARRDGRIDRTPPGSVRYATATTTLTDHAIVVAPAADVRNTRPPAVLTPREWGVVLPFRWVEIEGWKGTLRPEDVRRRAAFDATWDDHAARFASSDPMLNRVWALCHHSIKATTFAGVFVDGDRERIPYEADAFLNQLSYYACNPDPVMARDTFDYLAAHPTWPTEWAPQMIFMAHADWLQTGDVKRLAAIWEPLKSKLQLERAGDDGLLRSTSGQISHDDIVDWPAGERDGYEFREINTVVNAFHLRALFLMADLAHALGRDAESQQYRDRYLKVRAAFQAKLFDPARGLFRDGAGTEHVSLHANLFPLAFGLAPENCEAVIARWLRQRGMMCSVYAAQYLMEALFTHGDADAALGLMLAEGDRSWRHMVEAGATITWEAWDQRYKPNQDWNHAWGAAPANLLPRFILGVTATQPGWSEITVRPFAGKNLQWCEGTIPTPRGAIGIRWEQVPRFELKLDLPAGIAARVEIPFAQGVEPIRVNGQPVAVTRSGDFWRIVTPVTGSAQITAEPKR